MYDFDLFVETKGVAIKMLSLINFLVVPKMFIPADQLLLMDFFHIR